MTHNEQVVALAELDGIVPTSKEEFVFDNPFSPTGIAIHRKGTRSCRCWIEKDYRASYDAIIPLIQKQSNGILDSFASILTSCGFKDYKYTVRYTLKATPAQLAEALLRATGKWKE